MDGREIIKLDPWLKPFKDQLKKQISYIENKSQEILAGQNIKNFALGHLYFGLHKNADGWVFREWAPNAISIYLICEKTNWKDKLSYAMHQLDDGVWEIKLSSDQLSHLDKFKLHVYWPGGDGERLPSYANYVVQNDFTHGFDAVAWSPRKPYKMSAPAPQKPDKPIIYEAHIGMAGEKAAVSSYNYFRKNVLPRIKRLGYNTIQLMAIAEHPYYGSFGYQVSNLFAPSSRFGNPDELKHLIDDAHKLGISVILDVIHSHAVKNENEGLGNFAGDKKQYFVEQDHQAWDSLLFDYGKPEVVHFLLSNLRYWLDEFRFDGFRFDGVTSMIYFNHGLEQAFTKYEDYFSPNTNLDALTYLKLANQLIHSTNPQAITIAEDMSGMPALSAPSSLGGIGFDYRFNMGVPDLWIKMLKHYRDEDWHIGNLWHQLTSHRPEEKVINYAESHDQALVGDKTIFFRLLDKEIYDHMAKNDNSLIVNRGLALHKMIRLITACTASGYLNFMGNEFGHPEWIDFPRAGNNWSFKYARRQWSLVDNENLKYQYLNNFDTPLIALAKKLDDVINEVQVDEANKVISFNRGDYLLAFNFGVKSVVNYPVQAKAGEYKMVLSTDNPNYGGFNQLDEKVSYKSNQNNQIKIYLPARTAIVIKRH